MNSSILSTTFYRQPRIRNQDDKGDRSQGKTPEWLRSAIKDLIEISSHIECFQASRLRNTAQFALNGKLVAEAISAYFNDAPPLRPTVPK
jgi:hypothetical protein